MLLATLQSNGQVTQEWLDSTNEAGWSRRIIPISKRQTPVWNNLWCTNYDGDTLILKDIGAFRFIKIGDRVYKIESPRLVDVSVITIPATVSYGAISVTGVSNHSNEYSNEMVPMIIDGKLYVFFKIKTRYEKEQVTGRKQFEYFKEAFPYFHVDSSIIKSIVKQP